MAVSGSPPPRDHAMATAGLSLASMAGARTQNLDTAAIFWRKKQGILRSRLCHPCWSRAPCGMEEMLSPKNVYHPGSPCHSPAHCRIFFSQVFPNGREVSRPKQNSHTWGLSLAPAQPAQGKRCHGYREKKKSDPARRLNRWKCLIKDEKASGKFRCAQSRDPVGSRQLLGVIRGTAHPARCWCLLFLSFGWENRVGVRCSL